MFAFTFLTIRSFPATHDISKQGKLAMEERIEMISHCLRVKFVSIGLTKSLYFLRHLIRYHTSVYDLLNQKLAHAVEEHKDFHTCDCRYSNP